MSDGFLPPKCRHMLWRILCASCLLATVFLNAAAAEHCRASMAEGTVCACHLNELHPTQMAIGGLRVEELKSEGFDHLADHVAKDGRHAMVVVGPIGTLYIVDGHHHARAMEDLDATGESSCQIAKVVRDLPSAPIPFWTAMASLGLARLEGADGMRRPGVFPPENLRDLPDDPFRTVAGWIEDKCKFKLEGDFADFRLADLLRIDPDAVRPAAETDKDRSVAEGLRFLEAPANSARLSKVAARGDIQALQGCAVPE